MAAALCFFLFLFVLFFFSLAARLSGRLGGQQTPRRPSGDSWLVCFFFHFFFVRPHSVSADARCERCECEVTAPAPPTACHCHCPCGSHWLRGGALAPRAAPLLSVCNCISSCTCWHCRTCAAMIKQSSERKQSHLIAPIIVPSDSSFTAALTVPLSVLLHGAWSDRTHLHCCVDGGRGVPRAILLQARTALDATAPRDDEQRAATAAAVQFEWSGGGAAAALSAASPSGCTTVDRK